MKRKQKDDILGEEQSNLPINEGIQALFDTTKLGLTRT